MMIDFLKKPDGNVYDKDGNVIPDLDRNAPGTYPKMQDLHRHKHTGTYCDCINCGKRTFYTQLKPTRDGRVSGYCSRCVNSLLQDLDDTNMTNYLSTLGYKWYRNVFAKQEGKNITAKLTAYIKYCSSKSDEVLNQENSILEGKVDAQPDLPPMPSKGERDKEEVRRQEKSLDDIAYESLLEEQRIESELTDEEKRALRLKWGGSYKPSEWVQMEDTYNQYASEYEMTVDRENALRNICKVALKMDQALDDNDVKAYKDLSATYDMLRRSAKFTDNQRKEQKARDIDSVGQLVQFVEREGGIIPEYDIDPVTEPQDKIDYMIQDMKHYVDNLVKNELGLGNLIESFIKKEEENHVESADEMVAKGFQSQSDEDKDVSEEDEFSFQDFLLGQLDDEAQKLEEGDYEWLLPT